MQRGRAGRLIPSSGKIWMRDSLGRRDDGVGENEHWRTRAHLLSEGARSAMEAFVKRKIVERKERKLVGWDSEEANSRLAEVLFD